MEFFDSHCHIQSASPPSDGGEEATRSLWAKAGYPGGDALINHAALAGVNRMITVGCDLADSQLAVEFARQRPNVWASIGIHPHEAKDYQAGAAEGQARLTQFAQLAEQPIVAIGECGLDYFYGHSSPQDQAAVLRFQLELAHKYDKPLIFHVREAFNDFWPIFNDFADRNGQAQPIRGVLHSFTDSPANLAVALEKGLFIGVNGIATFTKSPKQLEMYKSIPLSRLLLETDSPFLTPSPWRGTICEPYHTSVTAEFLAILRDEPLAELAAATTANARTLFNV